MHYLIQSKTSFACNPILKLAATGIILHQQSDDDKPFVITIKLSTDLAKQRGNRFVESYSFH